MDMGLEGARALVTGSSEGIGRAIAEGLAAEGARVTICARREEVLERAAEKIRSATCAEVHAFAADLSRAQDCGSVVARAAEALGGLDVLVNNVGQIKLAGIEELSDEDWHREIERNVMSAVRCSRAAWPHLKEKGGRVVNITGLAGKQVHLPGDMATSLTKAALNSFTKTLAHDGAAHGILVNNVCPGPIETEGMPERIGWIAERLGISYEDAVRNRERVSILGRLGRPEEVANVAVFLASKRASFVTGAPSRWTAAPRVISRGDEHLKMTEPFPINPAYLFSRSEALSKENLIPKAPGVYAWYFKDYPSIIPSENCVRFKDLTLLYIGISPARAGTSKTTRNLKKRINDHFRGTAKRSTLRRSLGVLLSDVSGHSLGRISEKTITLTPPGEEYLNKWMEKNAFVCWMENTEPWEIEEGLIKTHSLPLNIKGNKHHSFYSILRSKRSEALKKARNSPIWHI